MKARLFKKLSIVLITLLSLIAIYTFLALISLDPARQPELGITYSKPFAQHLGLDWQKTYLTLLDELQIKYLRIPTYWNEVEPVDGEFHFEEIDWMIEQAAQRNAKVVLTMGMRQPRWPECHFPEWAKNVQPEIRELNVLELVQKTVERYKHNPAVEAWQVENEPLLEFFGECPRPDREFIKSEIDLVRALDATRPVVVTASGELSLWYPEVLWGDVLGSTLYRRTYNSMLDALPFSDGYSNYFLPPSLYRVKAFILGKNLENYWVAELQAEPWFSGDPKTTPLEEQYRSLSPEQLADNISFAYRVNPGRIYLWGAEWWVYTRDVLHTNDIWNVVKGLNW